MMIFPRKTVVFYATASATQSLPNNAQAVQVTKVTQVTGSGTWAAPTKYTVVSSTPSTGQVQFAGSPQSPSGTLTFPAALTAGDLLVVEYLPVGAVCAAA